MSEPLPPLPTLGPVQRRPPAAGARREWQSALVVAVRDETVLDGVVRARTFALELPGVSEPHLPGQHYVVRVVAPDGSMAQRSYSVASAPEPPGGPRAGRHLELTVERLDGGELSPYLHDEVHVGGRLDVRGPFGGWFVWRGDTPTLLLGGGSGVVPLMAMYRHRRDRALGAPMHLVISVRTPDDLLYADELRPGIAAGEVIVVHTRRAPDGDPRPPGRLDATTLTPLLDDVIADGATCYVCGSAGFAEHASRLLVDLGVAAGQVRVERFGPSAS